MEKGTYLGIGSQHIKPWTLSFRGCFKNLVISLITILNQFSYTHNNWVLLVLQTKNIKLRRQIYIPS